MHGLQAPWSQVTSARGLAETGSREGGEAAENYPNLLNHEWHHSRGTSAPSADCVHNPGVTEDDSTNPATVALGNPALKPEHANNYDLLYERYLNPAGILQAGFFVKQLSGTLISTSYTATSGL